MRSALSHNFAALLSRLLGVRQAKPSGTNASKIAVLAVTPCLSDRERLQTIAAASGWEMILADNCQAASTLIQSRPIPVILCDRDLPGVDWRESVKTLVSLAGSSCIVLISSVNDEYLQREIVHCGGYDVVTKPIQEEKIKSTVQLAWNYWQFESTRT